MAESRHNPPHKPFPRARRYSILLKVVGSFLTSACCLFNVPNTFVPSSLSIHLAASLLGGTAQLEDSTTMAAQRVIPGEVTGGARVSMDTSLTLQTDFRITQKELILRYTVTNPTSGDAYLLNRLYRTAPLRQMSADIIYIHIDAKNETVWLNKKLADLPTGVRVATPVAPYVTPLRAGSSFEETVHIPLPVQEWQEYIVPKPEAEEELKVRIFKHVYFTLGYYWKAEGTIEEIRDIHGSKVVFPRTPFDAKVEFGLLQSDLVKMDIPVLTFDSHP